MSFFLDTIMIRGKIKLIEDILSLKKKVNNTLCVESKESIEKFVNNSSFNFGVACPFHFRSGLTQMKVLCSDRGNYFVSFICYHRLISGYFEMSLSLFDATGNLVCNKQVNDYLTANTNGFVMFHYNNYLIYTTNFEQHLTITIINEALQIKKKTVIELNKRCLYLNEVKLCANQKKIFCLIGDTIYVFDWKLRLQSQTDIFNEKSYSTFIDDLNVNENGLLYFKIDNKIKVVNSKTMQIQNQFHIYSDYNRIAVDTCGDIITVSNSMEHLIKYKPTGQLATQHFIDFFATKNTQNEKEDLFLILNNNQKIMFYNSKTFSLYFIE
jgi:hypothetical protein